MATDQGVGGSNPLTHVTIIRLEIFCMKGFWSFYVKQALSSVLVDASYPILLYLELFFIGFSCLLVFSDNIFFSDKIQI